MSLEHDRKFSRENEIGLYLSNMPELFVDAVSRNGSLYDRCFEITDGFANITADAILSTPGIIKVLRYAISPTISQMKLGQMFGYNSTQTLEEGAPPRIGTQAFTKLQEASTGLADFLRRQIDKSRFIWIDYPQEKTEIALRYAKNWTCSVLSNSNAETAYRNLRKSWQEQTIADFLISSGYDPSSFRSTLNTPEDLKIGTFCKEVIVRGRTEHKADIVFRCHGNGNLCLVEAKAVGVLVDANKRVKECCDKAGEWHSTDTLGECAVFAVIAGFFGVQHIQALVRSNIIPVWEHRITDLLGQPACLHI